MQSKYINDIVIFNFGLIEQFYLLIQKLLKITFYKGLIYAI